MYFFKILILVLIYWNLKVGSVSIEPRSQRINAGKVAKHEDWPFMAAIVYGKCVACTGVLIRENLVITQAAWVQGTVEKQYTEWFGKMNVRLGPANMPSVNAKDILLDPDKYEDFEWQVPTLNQNDTLIGIEKIIIHDLFRPIDINLPKCRWPHHGLNNSALLKLSATDPRYKPIGFATHIFNECKNEKIECKAAGFHQTGTLQKLQETGKLQICSFMKSKVCPCSGDQNQMMKEFIKSINVTNSSDEPLFGEDKLLAITNHPLYVFVRDGGGPLICENLETKVKILQGLILSRHFDNKKKKVLNIFADVGYLDIEAQLANKSTTVTTADGSTTGKHGTGKPTKKGGVIVGKLKTKSRSSSI